MEASNRVRVIGSAKSAQEKKKKKGCRMSRLPAKPRRLLRRFLSPIAMRLLDFRCRFGPDIVGPNGEECVAVVASYLRPHNINTILATLIKCKFVRKIVLSNHNPDVAIEDYIDCQDDRIQVLNSNDRKYCGYRFKIANSLPAEYFIILDDDVFMFPEQVRTLFSHLVNDPAAPHGFHGILYVRSKNNKGNGRCRHIARREAVVDVLHQGYAVTHSHIEQMIRIAKSISESQPDGIGDPLRYADDILISLSGRDKARIHKFAPILMCPTALQAKVSVCRQPGFDQKRGALLSYLAKKMDHFSDHDSV